MVTAGPEVVMLVGTAAELDIPPRALRWVHMPVCVLDAVFSINASPLQCDRRLRSIRPAPASRSTSAPGRREGSSVLASRVGVVEESRRALPGTEGKWAQFVRVPVARIAGPE
jgi:hypothetical protein